MTLLDATSDARPERPVWQRPPFIFVMGVLLLSILIYDFANIWEERAVDQFLSTLQEGDFERAYQLWQPSESYTYRDFLRDWSERGDYGKIRKFEITASESKGISGVIVTVRINNVSPPLDLWVGRKTKALSYSPF